MWDTLFNMTSCVKQLGLSAINDPPTGCCCPYLTSTLEALVLTVDELNLMDS